jgi:1,4-alpha-glucan branching enzyme
MNALPGPTLTSEARAIIEGRHADPFHYLGMHPDGGRNIVRAFLPNAEDVAAIDSKGEPHPMKRLHDSGLFEGDIGSDTQYRLRARYGQNTVEIEDAYRFLPILSDYDLYLLGEGRHLDLYDKIGAHPMTLDGVHGVGFVVFAPNAQRVSVVGDFNFWDGRRHAMRMRGNGYWELFVPGCRVGDKYKYEIRARSGELLPLKADPMAFAAEMRPSTASIVIDIDGQKRPEPAPAGVNALDRPMSIYEVHLGSWRRKGDEDNRWLTYRELADTLPDYVAHMGFTHVELLPVMEHPFDGSWGYQPTGLYAPTSRFGSPRDFIALIEAFHARGIGVFLDWVPGHFPDDPHGMSTFDGTAVYEHANPMQGRHLDWGTLIYNYGRVEVQNFLLANALFWLDRYGIDGLRVDAVASMLYLDYSRPAGGWIPNRFGGRENIEAIEFLRNTNREVFGKFPNATTAAEESTAWPQVSRPIETGGLGFGYKWNMGWMHDTLNYISKDPIHRRHHHDQILFGLHYAFSENFILPLSHDEVVHGKGSILRRMPGDDWQRFANLRAYYAFMYGHPGKKLMFMGCEFGQDTEWAHDFSLPWHLLDKPEHAGVQQLIRDLNRLYRDTPALHERDCEPDGFEWLAMHDAANSVFAWMRKGKSEKDRCMVVLNFTPQVLRNYRIKVPFATTWREILNSDAALYGGSNVGNEGRLSSVVSRGTPELELVIPPLAALYLVPEL